MSVILSSDWSACDMRGSQWLRLLQSVPDPMGRCILFLIIKLVFKTCLNSHWGTNITGASAEPLKNRCRTSEPGLQLQPLSRGPHSSTPVTGKSLDQGKKERNSKYSEYLCKCVLSLSEICININVCERL